MILEPFFPFCYKIVVLEIKSTQTLVSRHPWDVKKVSVTGAGCLLECKNTELVSWGVEKNRVF